MGKIQTLFTFNNTKITIILFNNIFDENNILFYKSINIEPRIISNGYIANNDYIINKINLLIKEAQDFTNEVINEVAVCVDCSEVSINSVVLSEIKLDDGIINKAVWNRIKNESIEINQIMDKYIYGVEYVKWNVDGNDYYEISDASIAGKKLQIKSLMYQINKILYNMLSNIFNKLDIKIEKFFPMINTFTNLISNNRNGQNELFVYINNNALVICQTEGKFIKKCVSDQNLGLDCLYGVLSEKNNIDIELVKKILNTNILFRSQTNFDIINGCDVNELKLTETDLNNFKHIIDDYAESIASLINNNVKFLDKNKNIIIEKVTYIPTNELTKNIINLTQIRNNSNAKVFNDYYLTDYENYATQEEFALNYILKQRLDLDDKYNPKSSIKNYKKEIKEN